MRLRIILISTLSFLTIVDIATAAGQCAIDGQLSPRLAEYVRGVNELSSKLKQLPSSCSGKAGGIVSNSQRTLDVLDKAKAETLVMGSLGVDFDYNIKTALNGESRAAVTQNGKIFGQVEKTLISTLDVLATKCNMDTAYEGSTPEQIVIQRIRINDALETLYKNTALEYPGTDTSGIPATYAPLIEEIQTTYNPTATSGCKNEYSFEDISEKFMNSIGKISTGIESGLKDWKYAIALIRGGSSIGQEKYSDTKKRLLTQELQRQGYSAGAINQMVKGYNCVEAAMKGDGVNQAMDFAVAKSHCAKISVLGVDKFMNNWERMLLGSKGARTLVEYLNRSDKYQTVNYANKGVSDVYTSLTTEFARTTGTDGELLTKFINLHITLLDVNDRIEKRIPIMIANCKKAQPSIPCNF